jgi:hypothetical protein
VAGLFDFLGRIVNGQPVFDDEEQSKPSAHGADKEDNALTSPARAPEAVSLIRKHDDSSFPVVYVKRVTTHENGNKMQIYGWIQNDWPEEIMLDKIRFLNTTRELDSFLNGHGSREFLLYDGPLLQHEYHEAQLDYKTQREGDYFQAVHNVTFHFHPETKTYSVGELRLHHPIRDIYE